MLLNALKPDIPGYHGPATVLAFSRLAADPLAFFTDTRDRFGDLAWIRIGTERIVLVSDPALVDELLWKRHGSLRKDNITQRLRLALGDGLLTAEGPRWKDHRRRIAPSFQRGELAAYADTMALCAQAAVDRLQGHDSIELHRMCSALTLDIVHKCLFGSEVEVPASHIGDALDSMMDAFIKELRTWRRFVPPEVPLDTRATVKEGSAEIDAVLLDIIAHRRARIEREGAGRDLLDRLITATGPDGETFTDTELRDEAITLFVAGHETTALGLTYALTALSWHPEVRARLRDELAGQLGDDTPTFASVSKLPYLRAVIQETLRLYPPAWGFGRLALEDIELGGHHIPEGCSLFVLPWVLHRDARRFDSPLQFRPERWLDGLSQRLPRGGYLPFGGGPRVCVGNHFAMLELMVSLAVLERQVTIDVDPAHDFDFQASVTLRPGGPVPARVKLAAQA